MATTSESTQPQVPHGPVATPVNGDHPLPPSWLQGIGISIPAFKMQLPWRGVSPYAVLMQFVSKGAKTAPQTGTQKTPDAPAPAPTPATNKNKGPVHPQNGKRPAFGKGLPPGEVPHENVVSSPPTAKGNPSPPQIEDSALVSNNNKEEDFELEKLRFSALQLVDYRQVLGGRPAYLCDRLVEARMLPNADGHSMMAAKDLACRLTGNNEKPIEAVVYFNDPEGRQAAFATQLTLALLQRYGGAREVLLRALMRSSSGDKEEFQLAYKGTISQNPLAGKQVVLAVGPLTKDTWESVARQVFYLRGLVSGLKVVTIAKIGRLPIQGRAGIQIEAFTSYG